MARSNTKTPVSSLLWVEVTAPNVARHWARTSRIMAGLNQPERDNILTRLKQGQQIDYEGLAVRIQCPLMSPIDQNRLAHLTNFEEGGFQLTMFRADAALFYKNGQDYYSLREMAERGYWPTPAVAVNRLNATVTTFDGWLVDVFVPVGLATLNFFAHHAR